MEKLIDAYTISWFRLLKDGNCEIEVSHGNPHRPCRTVITLNHMQLLELMMGLKVFRYDAIFGKRFTPYGCSNASEAIEQLLVRARMLMRNQHYRGYEARDCIDANHLHVRQLMHDITQAIAVNQKNPDLSLYESRNISAALAFMVGPEADEDRIQYFIEQIERYGEGKLIAQRLRTNPNDRVFRLAITKGTLFHRNRWEVRIWPERATVTVDKVWCLF